MFRYFTRLARNNAMMSRLTPRDPLLVVLGATGTGKSELAVELAAAYNGEIINADAMQMYDGMPIITNKITKEEMKGIPHHLLGDISLQAEPWRVDKFLKESGRVMQEIRARGKIPVVVGGTHYYVQSLLLPETLTSTEMGEDVSIDRAEKHPILSEPTEVILARLREVDPVIADRWHPNDRRKILRSLQLYLETGQKASDIYESQRKAQAQKKLESGDLQDSWTQVQSTLLFWVHADMEVLKDRLDSRVDKMLNVGLMAEVESLDRLLRELEEKGVIVDKGRGIWVSIGWKEFEPYLRAVRDGNASKLELDQLREDCLQKMKRATRQYAKDQIRWIRIQLIHTLKDADSLDRLFLLDGTDLSTWQESVCKTAIKITGDFLEGRELPTAIEVSSNAEELLAPKRQYRVASRPDTWVQKVCEICKVTAVNEEAWETHLQSYRHKRGAKSWAKREAMNKYFEQKKAAEAAAKASEGRQPDS